MRLTKRPPACTVNLEILNFILDFLTPEDGTDRLFRNVELSTNLSCVTLQKSEDLNSELVCLKIKYEHTEIFNSR